MLRIRVLSHGDADGLAGAVAVDSAHAGDHVVHTSHSYDDVDKAFLKALRSKLAFDRIVLVDMSFRPLDEFQVREDGTVVDVEARNMATTYLPEAIDHYIAAGGELVVLDHHPRALAVKRDYGDVLHKDSICEIQDADGIKRAGSELGARYAAKRRPRVE